MNITRKEKLINTDINLDSDSNEEKSNVTSPQFF